MLGTEGPHRDCRGYGLTIAAAGGIARPHRATTTRRRSAPAPTTRTMSPTRCTEPSRCWPRCVSGGEPARGSTSNSPSSSRRSTRSDRRSSPRPRAQTVRRAGNRDDVAAPHGVYPCAGEDRWCAIAVFNDEQWAATRLVLGGADWADHPELDTAEGRRRSRRLLDELVAAATRSRDADQLAAELTARGVATSAVLHADDLVYSDVQLRGRADIGSPSITR